MPTLTIELSDTEYEAATQQDTAPRPRSKFRVKLSDVEYKSVLLTPPLELF